MSRTQPCLADRILVLLQDFVRHNERPQAPPEMTQNGLAALLGVRRSHVSQSLKTLRGRGYVEERTTRIRGELRRKKAYFITPTGYRRAGWVRAAMENGGEETCPFHGADGGWARSGSRKPVSLPKRVLGFVRCPHCAVSFAIPAGE
jgi:DNA-binding transcriptional ArsR family regulator